MPNNLIEREVFPSLREDICRTDGLVDETRRELELWFNGCEYLQVLAQVYELTDRRYVPTSRVEFKDVAKGVEIFTNPNTQFYLDKFEESTSAHGKKKNLLTLYNAEKGFKQFDRDEFQIFRTPEEKLFAIYAPPFPALFEAQQNRLRVNYPDLIAVHLSKGEALQNFIPEELTVMRNIREKCRAVLEQSDDLEGVIKAPSYIEHPKVQALMQKIQAGGKVTSEEIDEVLTAFKEEKRELVSYGVFRADMSPAHVGIKEKISNYFLDRPSEQISKSNGRQLVRHYAREYRKEILEFIGVKDLELFHYGALHKLFGFSSDERDYRLLLQRMFPQEYGRIECMPIEYDQLTLNERKNKINRVIFRAAPESKKIKWSEEEKASIIAVSQHNVRLLLERLIVRKKREADIEGDYFFAMLLSNRDIASSVGRRSALKVFGLPEDVYIDNLLFKAVPETYFDISDELVGYYLKSNRAKKLPISHGIQANRNTAFLSENETSYVKKKQVEFLKKLILRYSALLPNMKMLEQLSGKDLHKISHTLIKNITGIEHSHFYEVMRFLFPDDFGILTEEKWQIFKTLNGRDKAIASRILFSGRAPDSLNPEQRELFVKNAQKNIRMALRLFEAEEKIPIFAIGTDRLNEVFSAQLHSVFDLENLQVMPNLQVALGKKYRKLVKHTVRWCTQVVKAKKKKSYEALERRIFYFDSDDVNEKSISQHNGRLVMMDLCELDNKSLEELSNRDIPDGLFALFDMRDPSISSYRRKNALLFRMFPTEFGNLDEEKMSKLLPVLTSNLCSHLPVFFQDRLEFAVDDARSALSSNERAAWIERAKRNWLILMIYIPYLDQGTLLVGLSEKCNFLRADSLKMLFGNDNSSLSTARGSLLKYYDCRDSDDYRQFFWRNIVKFCGNPRTFFDLEEQGMKRFEECLEVFPDVWLGIMRTILNEKIEGKKKDKPVKEAIPIQIDAISALEEAMLQDKLGQHTSEGWEVLSVASYHPAVSVQEKIWQSFVKLREKMTSRDGELFKKTICAHDQNLEIATNAVEDLGDEAMRFWEDVQREINTELRTVIQQVCGEMPQFKTGNNYGLMSWRQERGSYQQIALDFCAEIDRKATDSNILDDDVQSLRALYQRNFSNIQERVAKIVEKHITSINEEDNRVVVIEMLESIANNKSSAVSAAATNIIRILPHRMATREGIKKLRQVILNLQS